MNTPDPLRAPTLLTRDYAVEPPRRRRVWPWVLGLLLALSLTPPATVLALRWLPPPTSAFMLQSPVKPVLYEWVPAAQVPDQLRKAAITAEDQKFWTHGGFDFEAIEKAMEHNRRNRRVRGASTISQQVAKNLFLWPSRSYLRKALEVTFTVLLELLWPKERILEVYLNIAEFGPGVYGAQAAAKKFFGKPASAMTAAECAQLVRFSEACGAEIPRWIRLRLERRADDKPALLEFGLEVVSRLCEALLRGGAPGLHFYTLNQSEPTLRLWKNLGLPAPNS